MIEIGKTRAIELLREVVKGRESYVYGKPGNLRMIPMCLYSHGDEPGCIVGTALAAAGVPVSDLSRLDKYGKPLELLRERGILRGIGVRLSQGACVVLGAAQSKQDALLTWGEALRTAEMHYAELEGESE